MEALLQCCDVFLAAVGQKCHELITADPRNQIIGTARAAQPAGHCPDRIVARIVTVAAIDELHLVDIDEMDADPARRWHRSAGILQGTVCPLQEAAPVKHTGEFVGGGQRVQFAALLGACTARSRSE